MSLKVSAILPRRPSSSPVIRTEKSPARIARSACRRFCNSRGEPGAELSSSDLPARFFGTPLAIFLLVTVVGCIDASRITRLHRHACARRGRSEAIRSELHGQGPINAKLPCHGCAPFVWDRTLTPSRSLQTLVTLERPPAIKSANPGKVPFRRCDIRSKAGSHGHASTALSRHHRYG